MKNDELKIISVQKTLNKVISEEIIANIFYNACILAVEDKTNNAFNKLFSTIAEDELNDHYQKLKNWAIKNDYTVPFKLKELSKYAETSVKQLENLKKNKDLEYYVDEAIKSEQLALASYTEVLENDEIPYDLNALIIQIYYDEQEHLERLSFMKYAFNTSAEII